MRQTQSNAHSGEVINLENSWLEEDDWFGKTPLQLMEVSVFADELEELWRNVGTTNWPNPNPTPEELPKIIRRALPESSEQVGMSEWTVRTPLHDRATLGMTAHTVWAMARHATFPCANDVPPRHVLVPRRWDIRMYKCLSTRRIPYAWIALQDALDWPD